MRADVSVVSGHRLAVTDPWIADAVSNAAWNHIVPHTRKSYACAFGAYERFCDLRLLEPYPVDAVSLSGFLVRMSTSVAPSLGFVSSMSSKVSPGTFSSTGSSGESCGI